MNGALGLGVDEVLLRGLGDHARLDRVRPCGQRRRDGRLEGVDRLLRRERRGAEHDLLAERGRRFGRGERRVSRVDRGDRAERRVLRARHGRRRRRERRTGPGLVRQSGRKLGVGRRHVRRCRRDLALHGGAARRGIRRVDGREEGEDRLFRIRCRRVRLIRRSAGSVTETFGARRRCIGRRRARERIAHFGRRPDEQVAVGSACGDRSRGVRRGLGGHEAVRRVGLCREGGQERRVRVRRRLLGRLHRRRMGGDGDAGVRELRFGDRLEVHRLAEGRRGLDLASERSLRRQLRVLGPQRRGERRLRRRDRRRFGRRVGAVERLRRRIGRRREHHHLREARGELRRLERLVPGLERLDGGGRRVHGEGVRLRGRLERLLAGRDVGPVLREIRELGAEVGRRLRDAGGARRILGGLERERERREVRGDRVLAGDVRTRRRGRLPRRRRGRRGRTAGIRAGRIDGGIGDRRLGLGAAEVEHLDLVDGAHERLPGRRVVGLGTVAMELCDTEVHRGLGRRGLRRVHRGDMIVERILRDDRSRLRLDPERDGEVPPGPPDADEAGRGRRRIDRPRGRAVEVGVRQRLGDDAAVGRVALGLRLRALIRARRTVGALEALTRLLLLLRDRGEEARDRRRSERAQPGLVDRIPASRRTRGAAGEEVLEIAERVPELDRVHHVRVRADDLESHQGAFDHREIGALDRERRARRRHLEVVLETDLVDLEVDATELDAGDRPERLTVLDDLRDRQARAGADEQRCVLSDAKRGAGAEARSNLGAGVEQIVHLRRPPRIIRRRAPLDAPRDIHEDRLQRRRALLRTGGLDRSGRGRRLLRSHRQGAGGKGQGDGGGHSAGQADLGCCHGMVSLLNRRNPRAVQPAVLHCLIRSGWIKYAFRYGPNIRESEAAVPENP